MIILLAEDNQRLGKMLCHLFKQENIMVDYVENGEDALEYVSLNHYDVIILDWMLPKLSGVEVCQLIREKGINSGVIILTAKGEKDDKIQGLNIGADDYVVKPADFDELLARVKAVARRENRSFINSIIKYGNIEMDTSVYSIKINDKKIDLTKKEYNILEILMRNIGNTITRDLLFSKIWNGEDGIMSNTLDVNISSLRKKLETYGATPQIKTLRGIGYRLEIGNN